MMKLTSITMALLLGLSAGAGAEDVPQEKLEKALAKYKRTGEVKKCITPSRMRGSSVIDDYHIIFQENGKKSYLTTLPRQCHSLGFHKAIAYEVRGSAVCKGEVFSVINGSSIPGGFCQFGKFEELKKLSKEELKALQSAPEAPEKLSGD